VGSDFHCLRGFLLKTGLMKQVLTEALVLCCAERVHLTNGVFLSFFLSANA
jgi:hypothetical protein